MKTLGTLTLVVALALPLLPSIVGCGSDDAASSDFGAGARLTAPGTEGTLAGEQSGDSSLAACATSKASAEPSPVYLVVMYDRSGSMDDNGKWPACKGAMKAFFSASESRGMSASLHFFPQHGTCDPTVFAAPAVGMTALPDTRFGDVLDQTSLDDGTPTRPALEGAVAYADQIAASQGSDGKVAIVLVTDGQPNVCDSSVGAVSLVAKSALSKYPTYVVGIGNTGNLDQIAQAGGTSKAFVVSGTDPGKTQDDLVRAMADIRQSALSCDYKIPLPPAGETLDKDKVNVVYSPKGGAAQTLSYNATCSGGSGWRYDDASAPTRILMCEGSCGTIKSQPGQVDVAFGCATRTAAVN